MNHLDGAKIIPPDDRQLAGLLVRAAARGRRRGGVRVAIRGARVVVTHTERARDTEAGRVDGLVSSLRGIPLPTAVLDQTYVSPSRLIAVDWFIQKGVRKSLTGSSNVSCSLNSRTDIPPRRLRLTLACQPQAFLRGCPVVASRQALGSGWLGAKRYAIIAHQIEADRRFIPENLWSHRCRFRAFSGHRIRSHQSLAVGTSQRHARDSTLPAFLGGCPPNL